MVKLKKSITYLMLILCFTVTFVAAVSGQTDDISNPRQSLEDISAEEKVVLEELFFLSQEIDEMMRKEKELLKESESIQNEILLMEIDISERQQDYDTQLKILEQVLVAYQKNGMASFFETLLSAENLTDFLKRLNVIQELSRNTGEMLQSMEEEKSNLILQREMLISNKALLEETRLDIQNTLTEKLRLKQEQEDFLASLSEEKEHYQEQLGKLDESWGEVKELFSDMSKEFSRVFNESDISYEDFNIRLDFLSVKGSITEDVINEIIEKDAKLPLMIFDISPEMILIEVPEMHLLLHGNIAIESESVLKFEVTGGAFYGMKLEKPSIDELFRDGYLLIDFGELIGDITLQSVEMKDGFIEFKVKPFF